MADPAPRAGDLLTDRKVLVDTVVPPVVFVTANVLWGLGVAAAVALGLAALTVAWRVARRQRLLYALSGLGGVVIGVLTALWSGSAEGYFGPGMLLNAGYAVAAVVSILVRRPLIAFTSAAIYRWPLAWYWHPRVRPAYSEVTWAWAALFAGRAWLRYVLIGRGEVEWLAVVSIVTGWPAFAALLVATYAYANWRLARLGGPDVETFEREAPATAG
jgi:hypothetical protein